MSKRYPIAARRRTQQRGAAILMFAVTCIPLLAVTGLALEVGWSYYLQKRAQTASDAAAMAAVMRALATVGPDDQISCGSVMCQAPTPCPSTSNLDNACRYAAANGLGGNANESVLVSAGSMSAAPGVPKVSPEYWVQVAAQSTAPPWFSGILSNVGLRPGATSTAAVVRTSRSASMYLLNRAEDCFVAALGLGLVCGEDLLTLGANTINAPGGIYMSSSNASGLGLPNIGATTVVGNLAVNSPFTYFMGKGGVQHLAGASQWSTPPINGFPDADYFTDPFAGRPQPPAATGLVDRPVPGGVITGSLLVGAPRVLPPGNYYATLPLTNIATGAPVTIAGNVVFSDGSGNPCGGFCEYVFYGGLVTAPLSNVTLAPGRYIFAGAQQVGGAAGYGLSVGALATFKDMTPMSGSGITANTDAGEILIFTNTSYPGLRIPAAVAGLQLPQVRAGIMGGITPQITLHGLNASSNNLPSELAPYAPVLIWQDRANTTLRYTPGGVLDTSCGGICQNILSVPGSQEMVLIASRSGSQPGTNLFGTLYSPRGSWLTIVGLQPGDAVGGPFQVITGALQMTLNTTLDLTALPNPPTRLVTGLIQ